MGTQYAGDDTAFPVDYTIPDDGDPTNASSVNVAFEALGDRTAFLKKRTYLLDAHSVTLATTLISSSETYVDVPGLELTIPCIAGDVLAIDACILLACAGAVSARVVIDDGGVVDPVQAVHYGGTVDGSDLSNREGVRSFVYTVINAGDVTIGVQAKFVAALGITQFNVMGTAYTDSAGSTLRAMQYRKDL